MTDQTSSPAQDRPAAGGSTQARAVQSQHDHRAVEEQPPGTDAERTSAVDTERASAPDTERRSSGPAEGGSSSQTERRSSVGTEGEPSADAGPERTAEDTPDDDKAAEEKVEGKAEEKQAEEEKVRAAEEFAREHDPADHDVAAGEEFRQRGDWTAEDGDGPQVLTADDVETPGATGAGPSGSAASSASSGAARQERTSSLEDVRDGGYGVGSAAPIDGGIVPLGHPVKAWEDTKTYVTPDHPGYGQADPHVWFLDAQAAQNAGFTAVD